MKGRLSAMSAKMKNTAKVSRRSKLVQNKANVRPAKITGARGRRVRIPRTADSFKSKTDHT